jgi:hypothetical protein
MATSTKTDREVRKRWGKPGDLRRNYDCTPSHPTHKDVHGGALLASLHRGRHANQYDKALRMVADIFRERSRKVSKRVVISAETEKLCPEFNTLANVWIQETRHLSLISQKIIHPAYFRIMGMGRPVLPLLLAALRDKPAHWFAALRAVANADPAPADGNASQARQAWLEWGRSHRYID